jgi:hypothetical protein
LYFKFETSNIAYLISKKVFKFAQSYIDVQVQAKYKLQRLSLYKVTQIVATMTMTQTEELAHLICGERGSTVLWGWWILSLLFMMLWMTMNSISLLLVKLISTKNWGLN